MYGCRGRSLLGLLLRLLTGERRDLSAVLGHLVEQELPLGGDQCGVCISRRREVGHRIDSGGECSAQPRDVELLRQEVVVEVIALGGVYSWIKLYQNLASLDRLPVPYPNGANYAGLERLDDLGSTAWDDFSGRRRNDIDGTPRRPDQRCAKQDNNRGHDRAARGRGRRLDDFQGGW